MCNAVILCSNISTLRISFKYDIYTDANPYFVFILSTNDMRRALANERK